MPSAYRSGWWTLNNDQHNPETELHACVLGCADVSPQTDATALLEVLNGGNGKRPGARQLTPTEQRKIGNLRMAGLATGD